MDFEKEKDLSCYKKLVQVFEDYTNDFKVLPSSAAGKFLEKLLENGLKSVPKNDNALAIIEFVLDRKSSPANIQDFLNLRFDSLPLEIRPMYRSSGGKTVAFWCREGKAYSKVWALISESGSADGFWGNSDCRPCKLIKFGGK